MAKPYFKFENLEVWQIGRKYIFEIYSITRKFPKDELFGLVSQLRRAASSILLNIAEGTNRRSDVEFKRYLRMSPTSLEETVSGLYIALDQKFIAISKFNFLYDKALELSAKLKALIKSLDSRF
jgi:four helix bundle protein